MELYLFAGVQDDAVLRDLLSFRHNRDKAAYFRAARALLRFSARANCADALRAYAARALLCSPGAAEMLADGSAQAYLRHDAQVIFDAFFAFDWDACCREREVLAFPRGAAADAHDVCAPLVSARTAEQLAEEISRFYGAYHDFGEAAYTAFRWENGALRGIRRTEQVTFDQLAGLAFQKQALLQNAQAFLAGRPAHNVLLVGGSGTGKSSCVKATLSAFAGQGLRLVELPKRRADELPALMEALAPKKCRYIISIDDLSFEEVDEGYRALKVALEGQVEKTLPHVLLYATSNRRHLVRETWGDRGDGDIHENDSLHEKKSLADRFGLRIYFSALSNDEYLDAVRLLLAGEGVALTPEVARQASAWALTYNGRSGRTAKQFASDLLSRMMHEE